MTRIDSSSIDDALPCRSAFDAAHIDATKIVLETLAQTSPSLLQDAGIGDVDWLPLLRAAIESMRGTSAATGTDKRRFIEAVLAYCEQVGVIVSAEFIGTSGRQDYRVQLPDGTNVGIEAKGCPDGNNTTIWDRPAWADEFVVWSLCPESLQHNPGRGVWSGVSTRLAPKITAERKVVDAFIFWDGRCGSNLRKCPKGHGVTGPLRRESTDIPSEDGKPDWLPPPCIYLFPRSAPTVPTNTSPAPHTVSTVKFARALLTAFNVDEAEMRSYVHEVDIHVRGSTAGTEIQVATTSRCWPDGQDRVYTARWKRLRRENF